MNETSFGKKLIEWKAISENRRNRYGYPYLPNPPYFHSIQQLIMLVAIAATSIILRTSFA
ncbi:hypothetical protein Q9251_15625 [Alkalihalobacillus macyae]|uniref:hypothetical protein n=1 Tax=Guptibacillus hwajinpoensis TaxID=208199 RepID=UPI00273C22CB|nr:hypothetical protein [Alkalihalobacillus macyae]MDP4552307.1 hypothetical protein [Alkalihalobacillus macyae]